MTLIISYDHLRNLTIFTATGDLTYEEQLAALKKFYGETPTANVLWDFRSIQGPRISSDELNTIISFTKRHVSKRPQGKTALVATADVDFGLSRVSEAYADIHELPWSIQAFRSMEEALQWIDAG